MHLVWGLHHNNCNSVPISEGERGQAIITISQHDVRKLQLVKDAIRTGIHALLESNGCSKDETKRLIIAGAFGIYINVASAVAIGTVHSLPPNLLRQPVNAAGIVAKLALIALSQRVKTQAIASKVKGIELARAADFNQTFIQASIWDDIKIIGEGREKPE